MKNDEKKIEAFIDKLIANETLEQPALDFTNKVMTEVEAISNSTATVYKPLIHRSVWLLIGVSFVALVGYIYLKEPITSSGWLGRFNLSNISVNPLENIAINFSSTLMYAFVLLAIMVSIQVPLLKHYFNKRNVF
ncbi:hypothetical protein [Winogradskyella sp. UBA3174]|uniref:hypothetical protein n=1 Tax=Winogradskyella sp. UBA3174 TaxID=1947785 RepID=UPI0025DC9C33|nr:hypothetical protein [Winogradskyella sp. UBA3174]|tara:strand:+ start:21035 stop:21439 length:405 start_codon:yes stop_codon:yes gene_type:complete